MLYVIKTENNDVIVFDSVTSFSESYRGSVTSHPVEDGSKISDHVITDNLKLKISGVVSDYNFFNPIKDFANQSVPAYNYDRTASLNKFGQDGLVADIAESIPEDYSGSDSSGNFSVKASSQVVKDKLISIFQTKTTITVLPYTMEGNESVVRSFENCIITDLSFDVNPESGYAIYPTISIEQINVVPVVVTQADAAKIISTVVKDQAAADANKGNQPGAKKAAGGSKAQTKDEAHPELVNAVKDMAGLNQGVATEIKASGRKPFSIGGY